MIFTCINIRFSCRFLPPLHNYKLAIVSDSYILSCMNIAYRVLTFMNIINWLPSHQPTAACINYWGCSKSSASFSVSTACAMLLHHLSLHLHLISKSFHTLNLLSTGSVLFRDGSAKKWIALKCKTLGALMSYVHWKRLMTVYWELAQSQRRLEKCAVSH